MSALRRLASMHVQVQQSARLMRVARAAPSLRHMSSDEKSKDSSAAAGESKQEEKKEEGKPLFSRFLGSKTDKASKGSGEAASESTGPVTSFLNLLSSLKHELIDSSTYFQKAEPYRPLSDRRRSAVEKPQQAINPNESATGVVVHEQSKWQSQWKNVTENNPVLDKLFEMKMRFDESDNIIIRGVRSLTDKVSEGVGNVLEDDESKAALAEIYKMDPSFDKDRFILHCERNVCPAVLEALIAGDVATLKDWCAEPCYNVLQASIEQRKEAGYVYDSKILDLRNVDILMAKMMDEGPVLILSFQTQEVKCVRDRAGAIVQGGEDHIERCWYILAMRRNPNIFDPYHAWQVLELGEAGSHETW